MSLEGNLTAFGLSEILQLIAVQQKSGMLSISSGDRSKVLFFRTGNIISTRDRRRRAKDPLKDFLTRYGILSREDLIRLTQISSQSKLDLTDIIVSEGFLSEEEMKIHYRNHIQEEVHELLTWEQCSYKFVPGRDIIDGIKTLGEFAIEGILMESMRRIDEFTQMQEDFPDPAIRIKKTGEPKDDQDMTTNETIVLQLLAAERTLGYLIAHAKIPRFETYEALKHLKDKKLIKVYVDKTVVEEEDYAKPRRKKKKKATQRRNALPFVASLVLFAAALAWEAKVTLPLVKDLFTRNGIASKELSIRRSQMESALRWRLEAYRIHYGGYPASLSKLKDRGLASDRFLRTIERYSFRYHLTSDGHRYTLL